MMEANDKNMDTRQSKVIFPSTLNDHETLFGGTAMQWMDEVAYITAIRSFRQKMVTVSVDKVSFLMPVKSGMIAEIIGKIVQVGNVKIVIQVEIYVEEVFIDKREKAVEALFTFAAVNHLNKPIRMNAEE